MIVRQSELARRAQHARALHAADRGFFDFYARQARADLGERRLHPRAHVRRAADDFQPFTASVDSAEGELVGVGMPAHLEDLRHHHAAELRADRLVSLDLEPGHRQALGQRRARHRRVAETAQPALGNVHSNCERKRRSPSKNRRISSMP